jgi:hypothetical protein
MKFTHYLAEPGVGKTTFMRAKLAKLREVEQDEWVKDGYVTYHKFPQQKVIILGTYDDGVFAGLDKWAKTAPPKFRQWVLDNAETFAGWEVFSEGERLSNNPTMDALFATGNFTLVRLVVSEKELQRRRAARNNTQNESWLRGMKTRIDNLCAKYPHTVEVLG